MHLFFAHKIKDPLLQQASTLSSRHHLSTRRTLATMTTPQHHRHHATPRSLFILPLLAILSITCLVFSEIEYLLPFSRLLTFSDENMPERRVDYNDFGLFPKQENKPDERLVEETELEPSPLDNQQMLDNVVAAKARVIDRIVLLGERLSGTSYTTQMLGRCFPELQVSDFLVRYKHWFQPTPEYVVNVTKTFLENGTVYAEEDMHKIVKDWPKIAAMEHPKSAFNRTLVIVMFRNAYDWLEAMRLGPHHWSNHFTMYRFLLAPVPDTTGNPWYGSNFLPWKAFLAANMTVGNGNGYNETHLCQNAYPFGFISPCRVSKDLYPAEVKKDYGSDLSAAPDDLPFNAHNPIYEMDENGKPFANPLELRTAKMRNLMNIPNIWDVGGFMTLQHEDVNSKGSGFLLEQVSKMVGMQPTCNPDPPKNQGMKELNGDWTNWISENVDWELEGSVGYERRPIVVKQETEESPGVEVASKEEEFKESASVHDAPKEEEFKESAFVHDAPKEESNVASKGTLETKDSSADLDVAIPKSASFDRIVLLGERHSGTSYTTRMLGKCFPGLDVSDFLVRYKHWFQPTPEYVVNVTKSFLQNGTVHVGEDMHKISQQWPKLASLENPKSAFNRTLVIVMFRNAYDWLEAMRLGPHHWSNHFTMYRFLLAPVPDTTGNPWYGSNFLPWKAFLAANMTVGNGNGYNETHLCQNAYPFGFISPCRVSKDLYPAEVKKDYGSDLSAAPDDLPFNAHNPIYEMDETGKPFANPLELRTAKMRNLMNIPNIWDVGGFMTLQHEDVNSKGSGFLLEQVSKMVGMQPSCNPDPPKNQGMKELNGDWTNWISENVDWELEGSVGYERRPIVVKQETEESPGVEVASKEEEFKESASVHDAPKEEEFKESAFVHDAPKEESNVASKGTLETKDSSADLDVAIPKSASFDRIVLLGERHSGTSYTTRMLGKCFPGLDVSDFLVRYKHWFQPTPEYVVNVTKSFLQNGTVHVGEDMHKISQQWPKLASLENPKSAFNRTLVIVMFRNVYDWLEAMRLGPHHWSNHFTMYRFLLAPVPDTTGNPWYGSNFLPWKGFLAANMTVGNGNGYNETHLCQNAFPFGSISPCRVSKDLYPAEVKKDYGSDLSAAPDTLPFNAHNPIYEMDETGKPFANPLELRTAKIRNFMDIPNIWDVGGFMTLQHEDVNSKGSGFLLEQVGKIIGIPSSCEPDAPKNQVSKELDSDWEEWISANADWEAEGLLGYKSRGDGQAAIAV